MSQKTTVKVSHETWRRLTNRKEPGKSYDDIISELLDEAEGDDGDGASTEVPAQN